MSKYGVISGPYFPHSDWIRRDTKHLSIFSPNARKYGPEITSYLDTFHAVIFNDTHRRRATMRERRDLPCPFWKSKKCPGFWKRDPDYVQLWVKFSIQNIVLRVAEKTPQCYPVGSIFQMFLTKYLSKCPSSTNLQKENLLACTYCPANNYLLKVNNRNTRKKCEIFSELTIKT